MTHLINLDAIFEATIFAARKHQGQVRKDEHASPYITHPLAVAREIYATGQVYDLQILIAAILHDTLEDTHTSRDEIRLNFGEEVLSMVLEVSDDKSLPKDLRKQLQVIHAPELTHPGRILKFADKIVNCRDILFTPPKDWDLLRRQNYIQWVADVLAQIRGTNQNLEDAFDNLVAEAEVKLNFSVKSFATVNQRPWGPNPENPIP